MDMTDAILGYKKRAEDDLYAALGCDPSSSCEQILSEFKSRVRDCHPDKFTEADPSVRQAKESQFKALQHAKEILTNEDSRKLYDGWRLSGVAIPFDNWLAKKDFIHMSMHWAGQKQPQPMIEQKLRLGHESIGKCGSGDGQYERSKPQWERQESSLLHQFRNYNI